MSKLELLIIGFVAGTMWSCFLFELVTLLPR